VAPSRVGKLAWEEFGGTQKSRPIDIFDPLRAVSSTRRLLLWIVSNYCSADP
jgi:hypothetical protein